VTRAENQRLADLSGRERLVFAPILLLVVWMGVFPQPFLDRAQPTLDRTIELCRARTELAAVLDPAGGSGVGAVRAPAAGGRTGPRSPGGRIPAAPGAGPDQGGAP
jgi:NADH-quinone oxidoreductase subunit M